MALSAYSRLFRVLLVVAAIFTVYFFIPTSSRTSLDTRIIYITNNVSQQQIAPNEVLEYPSLTLLIRAYHESVEEILKWTFPSVQIFWPTEGFKVNWTIVLDWESPKDHDIAWKITNSFPFPKVFFEALPTDPSIFHGNFKTKGYDRQQYSNFFCDLYTNDDVIGIMDSDAIFITGISPHNMFEGGKPVVIGAGYDNFAYPDYVKATEEALGIKAIGHFMNNFPVLAKREVFPALRAHVEKIHGKSFDRVFGDITAKYKQYCQFDWIINFMWHFRHEDYAWHLHFNQSGKINDFSALLPIHGENRSVQISEVNKPKARVATHLSKAIIRQNMTDYLLEGICFSSNHSVEGCNKYEDKLHVNLMRFELEPVWYPLGEALTEHYSHLEEFNHRLTRLKSQALETKYPRGFRRESNGESNTKVMNFGAKI